MSAVLARCIREEQDFRRAKQCSSKEAEDLPKTEDKKQPSSRSKSDVLKQFGVSAFSAFREPGFAPKEIPGRSVHFRQMSRRSFCAQCHQAAANAL